MLSRMRKSMDEKDEGFTLIELLVVIIIIGILAAIAIPVFLNQRKKAVDASMKSDLRTVAAELETYYTDYQKYPATADVSQSTQSVTVGTGGSVVKVSSGNTITYTGPGTTAPVLAGTYCIKAVNTNGTADWYYDSDQGGLQAKGAVCS